METVTYGDDPSQFFEVTRPSGQARGVAVVIHGGFWKAEYDLSLGRPLAASLADEGWLAVNLEYRRLGNGGGWPMTFDDVHRGIEAIADLPDVDLSQVVTIGHSAGGHLAVWAAGREQVSRTEWNSPTVAVTAAVSQAGVLDLETAHASGVGGGTVAELIGEPTPARFADTDPLAQAPLDIPVLCVHATGDDTVPISQSEEYVAVSPQAELRAVSGDHFTVIDPSSDAWRDTVEWVNRM